MKNVLLPTDFSDNSWNAIKYALSFLKQEDCNFYLLHVNRIGNLVTSNAPQIVTKVDIENTFVKPTKLKLRTLIKRISEECPSNSKHNFYSITEYNFFIEGIRRQIEDKQIDLIIMGTKGATGLEKLILGSNTADVITKVKCNTLAIPQNAIFEEPEEIGFATDFSLSYNLQLLQPMKDVLKKFNSYLRILHINKKQTELNPNQKASKGLLEEFFETYNYSFHFLTNKNVEDAVQCFVESRDIKMLCMVAKNLNIFQQILFHSRVENISYHTDIPFLVLHDKDS